MKSIITAIFVLLPLMIFSQYRAKYEYRTIVDTVNNRKIISSYNLDIEPKTVKFYDERLYRFDSASKASGRSGGSMTLPSWTLGLKRSVNSSNNSNFAFADGNYYQIESHDPIQWQIEAETRTQNGYQLQKATTNFGGRKWTAWFAPAIPVQEGPYKFRSLPGLIFDVEDQQQFFKFSLISIARLTEPEPTDNFLETNFGKKPLAVSLQEYKKILLNAYNNPFAEIRARMQMGEDYTLAIYGKQIRTVTELDNIKRTKQDEIRKNYNPIERDKKVDYR